MVALLGKCQVLLHSSSKLSDNVYTVHRKFQMKLYIIDFLLDIVQVPKFLCLQCGDFMFFMIL
jgi:hypothetical protein